MLELSILAGARDNLDEAYNYDKSKEIGLGDRFLSYVEDGFSIIWQHPEIFPVCALDFRRALVSKCPFEIIYKNLGNRVVIDSVFNCHRNPKGEEIPSFGAVKRVNTTQTTLHSVCSVLHPCGAFRPLQTLGPFLRILRAMENLVNSHHAIFAPVKECVRELPR